MISVNVVADQGRITFLGHWTSDMIYFAPFIKQKTAYITDSCSSPNDLRIIMQNNNAPPLNSASWSGQTHLQSVKHTAILLTSILSSVLHMLTWFYGSLWELWDFLHQRGVVGVETSVSHQQEATKAPVPRMSSLQAVFTGHIKASLQRGAHKGNVSCYVGH